MGRLVAPVGGTCEPLCRWRDRRSFGALLPQTLHCGCGFACLNATQEMARQDVDFVATKRCEWCALQWGTEILSDAQCAFEDHRPLKLEFDFLRLTGQVALLFTALKALYAF